MMATVCLTRMQSRKSDLEKGWRHEVVVAVVAVAMAVAVAAAGDLTRSHPGA
jgi:hypothetical protein